MSKSQQGWLSYFLSHPSLTCSSFSWFYHGSPDSSSGPPANFRTVVLSDATSDDAAASGTAVDDPSNSSAHSDSSSIVHEKNNILVYLFSGRNVIHADRPRDSRRPWLPKFPKLKRHYPPVKRIQADRSPRANANPPPHSHRKPRSFPRQALLADTIYPRLDPSDHRQKDICLALASLHRQRAPKEPEPAPRALRPPENPDTVFVEINGIRTNKRRAEDLEVDLVASIQNSTNCDPPSSISVSREVFLPESEFEFQEKVQAHMSDTKPLPELISGMMTNILSTFSDLTEKFSRILYNKAYEVSESRSYIEIKHPHPRGIDVAKKRVKLTSEKSDFQWLDRDGLHLLLSRYDHFCHCFSKAGSILYAHPLRAEMNKLLKPLLPALADDANDLRALSLGYDGTDLLRFWAYSCRSMITYLNSVYEIGSFIKMKDKYPRVPTVWPNSPSPEDLDTAARIQKFLSDPSLFVVLKTILELSDDLEDYPMPTDMIDRVVLDMAAFQHNIVLPSYVQFDDFHDRLLESFPPPKRLDPDYVYPVLPGAFPEIDSEFDDISVVDEPEVPPSPPPSVESPLRIAKTGSTKTDRLRAEFLAAEVSRLTPEEFQSNYYGSCKEYREIKKTYITDFTAKEPLTKAQIGTVKSILKNRKAPKRLTMTRAPKAVRFTEGTITPRQRTHLGLDVRRLFPKYDRAIEPVFIGGIKLGQSGRPIDKLDMGELEYLRDQHADRHVNSIFHGAKRPKPQSPTNDAIDPSLAIERMLSAPAIQPLAISDDIRAGIAIRKEQAAQKAAEDAKKCAEERARQELEKKLAKTGGLRVPEQPLVSPLSNHWNERAQETLRKSPKTTLAKTGDGTDLRRHDFATVVKATEWLNDEIVNGCLNWLDQSINLAAGIKDVKKSTRKCLAMSSFFFKYLRENGFTRSEKTLRRHGVEKKNFLHVDTLLLPICEGSHWTLLVIRPSKKTIAHMDSLNPRGSSQTYMNLGLKWLKYILEETFVEDEWKVAQHEAPRQTNGYDCGVHTITNGMCVALGLNPIDSYTTEDMPLQRLRLASMLLNGGFKGDFDLGVY